MEFRVWSKLLCSWSDVFAAMFTHDCKEKSDKVIEISDFSAPAVSAFLRFLYSGNLQVDPANLIEVGALADKYAVASLQEMCDKRVADALKPQTACEMLEASDRLGSPSLRESCLKCVCMDPSVALKTGFILNPSLLEEVLGTHTLCINDLGMATVLLEWASNPAAKARGIDVAKLLRLHVQIASLEEAQYAQLQTMADAIELGGVIKDMWSRHKRGTKTSDLFKCLWGMWQAQFKDPNTKPPFLGYWVNLIPSQGNFCGLGEANHAYLQRLQNCAGNQAPHATIGTNDELIWFTPHRGIFISGLQFTKAKGAHIEIFYSHDGTTWHMLAESTENVEPAEKVIPCSTKGCSKWFKLRVRKGTCQSNLRLHGIVSVE